MGCFLMQELLMALFIYESFYNEKKYVRGSDHHLNIQHESAAIWYKPD